MKYMPQLDSLRAFAVLLVIFSHWLPKNTGLNFTPNGLIGVTVFFVLSGFLISKILIYAKEKHQNNKKKLFKNFYIRRALRIFPLFYLTLAVLCFAPDFTGTAIKEDILYHLGYLTNFLFFFQGSWDGIISHFWTLAAEEQFYLIWPLILIFTPNRHLLKAILAFIFIGIGSRYWLIHNYNPPNFDQSLILTLTPTCFDAFGIGALIAYFQTHGQKHLHHFKIALNLLLLPCLAIFIYFLYNFPPENLIYNRPIISIISAFIIIHASENIRGPIGWILNLSPLQYLGKISYSIYIFHNFLRPFMDTEKHFFLALTIVTIISSLSWFLIEKPFNNLKKHFAR